jgi:hypothetical protein
MYFKKEKKARADYYVMLDDKGSPKHVHDGGNRRKGKTIVQT